MTRKLDFQRITIYRDGTQQHAGHIRRNISRNPDMPRHQAPAHDPWDPFRRQAAQHLHRLAHAAGRRHRRGWPPLDQADFARFSGRGGGHGWGPRGGRAARGDIRAAILVLLSEQPSHGYQIIQEVEARSGGTWRVSPGSVYPTLQQLEDEELVRAEQTDGGGRRVYQLTDAGRERAAAREGDAPWTEAVLRSDDDLVALRELAFGVLGATRQVVHAGDKEQIQRAQALLRETRRSLYQLLAEGPEEPASS